MLITVEMIWNRLNSIEEKLNKLLNDANDFSIEEVSLNKACKLLHLGTDSIINLVKTGKLKARTYRDSKRRIRYRFLLKDIKAFQESNKFDHISLHSEGVESSEEIAKRIFKNKAV